jgi:hypothetical protein
MLPNLRLLPLHHPLYVFADLRLVLDLSSSDQPELLVSQMLHLRSGSLLPSSWSSMATWASRRLVEIGIALKYLIWDWA